MALRPLEENVSEDLVCYSHLRWDFVTQRPNHLMTRAARDRRVFFVEEPVVNDEADARLEVRLVDGVHVVRPQLPPGLRDAAATDLLRERLDLLLRQYAVHRPVAWYYTPMALPWSEHVPAAAVVYDCMDELSAFRNPPAGLVTLERALLGRADLVFTGGESLYRAKRGRHPRVVAFPSSVDAEHFRAARLPGADPADQAGIARPRIGWFGVIDERVDVPLLAELAERRPVWQLVLVGPFAKIDPGALPRPANVHWLGAKAYADLPAYLRGWDVAMMPFARNDATRYISPTKTPEYLAAGRPVVSTSITDVVEPYGRVGLVHVADDAAGFEAAIEAALAEDRDDLARRADAFLAGTSWDATWSRMAALVRSAADARRPSAGGHVRTHPSRPGTVAPVPVPVPSGPAPIVATSASGAGVVDRLPTGAGVRTADG